MPTEFKFCITGSPGVRGLCLVAFCLVLAACGFRLAGTADLPRGVSKLYLQTEGFREPQREALQHRLRAAGAELLPTAQPGAVSLSVEYRELADRKLVSSASSGATVERVSRGIDFSLKSDAGEMLMPRRSLVQSRDTALDENNLLSSAEEKERVLEDLDLQLFDQLLRQLQRKY